MRRIEDASGGARAECDTHKETIGEFMMARDERQNCANEVRRLPEATDAREEPVEHVGVAGISAGGGRDSGQGPGFRKA